MAIPQFSRNQFLNLCERALVTMAPNTLQVPRMVTVHGDIARVYAAVRFGEAPFKVDLFDERRGSLVVSVEFPSAQSLRGRAQQGTATAVLPTMERLELAEECGKSWIE